MTKFPLSRSFATLELETFDLELVDHNATLEGLLKVKFPFLESSNIESVRGRNFRRGCSLADEHTAPREVVPVNAFCWASASLAGLSGKACRAKLVGKG
ncbi:hypothetical protein ACFX13_000818 [Malus domestica]